MLRIESDIRIAQIIGDDDDDVGLLLGCVNRESESE
jgi:hypothetical protein